MPHLTKSIEVVFTANHLTDTHIGLCSVLRPRQHSIGYMGDGFLILTNQAVQEKHSN